MSSKLDLHELKVLECIFVGRVNSEVSFEEHCIVDYLENAGFNNPRMAARLAFLKLLTKEYICETLGIHGEPGYFLTEVGEKLFLDYPIGLENNQQYSIAKV